MGNLCRSSKTTGSIPSNNLSPKQLEELHQSTNIPEREILVYYRQFIRASPTGRMTHAQFENELKTMDASTDASKAIFQMIDKDHSGQISFQEYLLSIAMFSQQSQPEQQLGAVFDTYQALARQSFTQSSDGRQREGMRREDIEHMLKRMHPQLAQDHLEKLCDRYMDSDQNKNGYISKQEFIAACMKNSELMDQLGHKDATIKEHPSESEH